MGKAIITAGGGNGSYTIKPLHNRVRIESEISSLESFIERLEQELEEAREHLELHELNVEEWSMLINTMIDEYESSRAFPASDPGALISAHNAIRSLNGLSSLTENASLMTAAQNHADWMNDQGTVSHTGANGSSPRNRMTAAGFVGPLVGENVAAGQDSVGNVMDAWMASPGHRANILTAEFNQIGYGYAFCQGGAYGHYWCINFGAV